MKNFFFSFFSITLIFIACGKKVSKENPTEASYEPLSYDTVAVDSFSPGAISVDVAEQIRRSSIAYLDSVKKVAIEQEKAKIAQEEANKKKEEERIKKEAAKKSEESAAKTEETPQ